MNLPQFETDREERIFLDTMHNATESLIDMFKSVSKILDPNFEVIYTGKKNGQWGYYPSKMAPNVAILMRKYGLHSIVDLGSGAGLFLLTMKHLGYETKGIEIEESLVKLSHSLGISTQQKDILKLTKPDIKKFGCIYFWEPLRETALCEKFVENLAKVVTKGQYIIYDCAGNTEAFLNENKKFKYLETKRGLRVYIVT